LQDGQKLFFIHFFIGLLWMFDEWVGLTIRV
jgi:hypothetical protein